MRRCGQRAAGAPGRSTKLGLRASVIHSRERAGVQGVRRSTPLPNDARKVIPYHRAVPGAREEADVATSSADYARRFAGGVGAWFLEVQAKATVELLAPWPGASVLDVGGG